MRCECEVVWPFWSLHKSADELKNLAVINGGDTLISMDHLKILEKCVLNVIIVLNVSLISIHVLFLLLPTVCIPLDVFGLTEGEDTVTSRTLVHIISWSTNKKYVRSKQINQTHCYKSHLYSHTLVSFRYIYNSHNNVHYGIYWAGRSVILTFGHLFFKNKFT